MFRVSTLICQSSFRFPVSYSTRSVRVHTAHSLSLCYHLSIYFILHCLLHLSLRSAASTAPSGCFTFLIPQGPFSLSLSLSLCHSVTIHHFHVAPHCRLHISLHSAVSTAPSSCFTVHSVYLYRNIKLHISLGF
jgi:hypothetical protein